jgi:hypothetical protein
VAVDYVSKWVEVVAYKTNDHRVVLQFLKENVFVRFGTPHAIISDGGKHLCNRRSMGSLTKLQRPTILRQVSRLRYLTEK